MSPLGVDIDIFGTRCTVHQVDIRKLLKLITYQIACN